MSHNFRLNQQINFFPPWNVICIYLGWFLETCFRRDSLVGHVLPQNWQERVKLVTCFASIWTDIAYLSREVWLHSEQAYPEDPPARIILFSISSSKDPTCPGTPYFEYTKYLFNRILNHITSMISKFMHAQSISGWTNFKAYLTSAVYFNMLGFNMLGHPLP